MTQGITALGQQLIKDRLQKQADLDDEIAAEKHRNEVQNRLIDQINDKIKQLQRIVDELQNRQKEEQRKLNNCNELLEKERRAAEQDEERNEQLAKMLVELQTSYQK